MKPVLRKAGLGGWWCEIGFENIAISRVTGCIETAVSCKCVCWLWPDGQAADALPVPNHRHVLAPAQCCQQGQCPCCTATTLTSLGNIRPPPRLRCVLTHLLQPRDEPDIMANAKVSYNCYASNKKYTLGEVLCSTITIWSCERARNCMGRWHYAVYVS